MTNAIDVVMAKNDKNLFERQSDNKVLCLSNY